MLYNRKLSDAERVKVENYLRNKWAPIKPFVPSDLVYSCMGWFDAADPASLTLVDGKVSVWTNKGSYGFGMGQPTATYRPTYGDSVVLLNNPTVLNIGGVPPDSYMDMIWVGKPNSLRRLADAASQQRWHPPSDHREHEQPARHLQRGLLSRRLADVAINRQRYWCGSHAGWRGHVVLT